jgi:MFS family permease
VTPSTPDPAVVVEPANGAGWHEAELPDALPQVIPSGEGFGAVLRNRYFLAIWSAQVTSQTAQNAVWYVLIILIAKLTGANALSVGGIIIMVQLPTVLFSGLSGVLVDRFPKKTILIATNFIRAVAVVGYLFLSGYGEALYLITFVVAVVSQPFQPAEGATIPLLVSEEQLITANSLFQATFMASQIVGFGLAAVLILAAGQTVTFFVLIGLFAYAGAILFVLPPSTTRKAVVVSDGIVDAAQKIWHELLEGTRSILADRKLLIALVQITFAPTFLLLLAQVAPTFLKQVLHVQQITLMFLVLAPAGLGMGIGLFILGHWGNRLRKDRLVVVALLALSVSVLGLADVPSLAHEFWLPFTLVGINPPLNLARVLTMIPLSLLIGIEIAFINAPLQTIVQERAPEELRGRILAMQQTLTAAVAIPPLLIIGGVASAIGIQGSLGLVGVALFMVALASVYGI